MLTALFAVALTIDLASAEGAAAVGATWRYRDVRIIEVPAVHGAGVTNDLEPQAGAADFNDASWEVIAPSTLGAARGNGRVSFAWYRVRITVPETVDGEPVAGMQLFFETVADDYAEIWVDGQLPRNLGQSGGTVVAGFNAPNRVLLTPSAVPGQQIQLAIFGINGPISDAPENFIFLRYARLELVSPPPRQRSVSRKR